MITNSRDGVMVIYFSFVIFVTIVLDCLLATNTSNYTWLGVLFIILHWTSDIYSLTHLILFKRKKSELKVTGVGLQVRCILASTMFSFKYEHLTAEKANVFVSQLLEASPAVEMLCLYFGIYHCFMIKDLFKEEASKRHYVQVLALLFGV